MKRRISNTGFTEFSFSRASDHLILRSRVSRYRRNTVEQERKRRWIVSRTHVQRCIYPAVSSLSLSSLLKSDRPRASTRPSLLYVIAMEGMGTGLRGHRIPTSVFPPRCAITHHRSTRRTPSSLALVLFPSLSSSLSFSPSSSLFTISLHALVLSRRPSSLARSSSSSLVLFQGTRLLYAKLRRPSAARTQNVPAGHWKAR